MTTMTPTEAITALEKALEAGPTPGPWLQWAGSNIIIRLHSGKDRTEDLRICEVAPNTFGDAGRANAMLIAAANPLAIRTLLDAHAGALRDAERYRTLKYAPTELIQDLIVAAPGRWDDIADAARAALATNTKGAAE